MKVVFVVRVVEHGVEIYFVNTRYRTDVTGQTQRHLLVIGAVKFQQLTDFDRLACVTDKQLVAGFD